MSELSLAGVIILSVAAMSLAIIKFRVHPAVAILLAAAAIALCAGMETSRSLQVMAAGFASLMKSIGIVVVAGCIIGTVMQKTGSSMAIASYVLNIVGKSKASEALGITRCATGISVFCDSGFIILSPIAKAFAKHRKFPYRALRHVFRQGLFLRIAWCRRHLVPQPWLPICRQILAVLFLWRFRLQYFPHLSESPAPKYSVRASRMAQRIKCFFCHRRRTKRKIFGLPKFLAFFVADCFAYFSYSASISHQTPK